jgi:hypothetical protein
MRIKCEVRPTHIHKGGTMEDEQAVISADNMMNFILQSQKGFSFVNGGRDGY